MRSRMIQRLRQAAIGRMAGALLATLSAVAAVAAVAETATEAAGRLLPDDAIVVTPPTSTVGQGVHLAIAPSALSEAAAAAGVDVRTFRREAEYAWRFSPAAEEDYVFDALPDDMRGPRTAGSATGPFAAHVYRTPGRHRIEMTLRFRGDVHRAVSEATVLADRTPATRIAVVDPDGRFDGAPRRRFAYRDLDEALLALERGVFDTLLLRRGATYRLRGVVNPRTGGRRAAYRIEGRQSIDAFGDPALAPPVIIPVFGEGALTAYRARLRASGDGVRRAFDGSELAAGSVSVYVDGDLLDEGRDYDVENGALVFAAPPPSGARILAFRSRRGALEAGFPSLLQVTNGDGARLRNFEIRGPYDPTAPGVFDPTRLETFEHAIHFDAILVVGRTNSVTLSDLRISGLRSGIRARSEGEGVFIANAALHEWHDYGVYLQTLEKTAVIGSDIRQPIGARNGPGAKGLNLPGIANYADHGPIRTPLSVEMVVNRSRLDSRTAWTASHTEALDTQSVARLAASARAGMSFSFTENHTTIGDIAVGAPNAWTGIPRFGLVYFANNWMELGVAGRWFIQSVAPFTSISNVYMLLKSPGHYSFQGFGFFDGKDYVVAPDAEPDPPLSINDSFIVLANRPDQNLTLTRPYPLALRGVANVVSLDAPGGGFGAFEIERTGRTVTVPVRVPLDAALGPFSWRIWRIAVGAAEEDAIAFGAPAEQAAVYRIEAEGVAAAELGGRAVAGLDRIDVTLETGRFEAGEKLLISREHTMDSAAEGGAPIFMINNPAEEWVLPPAELHNPLIIVEGEWRTVRIRSDEAPVSAGALRASRIAPLDALYRPLPGSPALGAARDPLRAAGDFRAAPRPPVAALGALEAGTDLSGLAPPPEAPGPIAVTWVRPPIAGTPLDASHLQVTLSDPGRPAVRVEDVEFRFAIEGRASAPGQPVTPAPGEIVRVTAAWPHLTGWVFAPAPPAAAQAPDREADR